MPMTNRKTDDESTCQSPLNETPSTAYTWARREQFALYIRSLRLEAGLTLRASALKLGVSFSYISKLESGLKENAPSLKVMRRIAGVYERNLGEVLDVAGIWLFDRSNGVSMANTPPGLWAPDSTRSPGPALETTGQNPPAIGTSTETTEVMFQRLLEHESLRPDDMASSEFAFIPTIVKKRWLSFARKLQEAVLTGELRVEDVIKGKCLEKGPK